MATRRDTRSFTSTVTTQFPKMGDNGMADVVNMSGQRSPYTMPVGRKGAMNDSPPDSSAAHRNPSLIHEANGPRFAPIATRGQAPEYPATGRAMRTVPSTVGCRDFWDRRSDEGGQVIG